MENHAVCVPFPAQGHIRPMLKLAQLLHFKFGFHITFINTHHIHQTLFKDYNSSFDQNKTPVFTFESLPKGGEDDDPKDILSVINSVVTNKLELPLKELLSSKLGAATTTSSGSEPRARVTCMISDVGMSSFTLRVAEDLGIPAVLLETASACGLLAYFHYRQLLDKGIIPLKDESWLTNGYLEKSIDFIPSLKGICLKDIPTFVRTTDPNDMMLNIVMLNAHRALNSSNSCAILINTFDALEQDVLEELSTISPNIYPIGPLNLLVDYHISRNDTITIDATHLFEESQEDKDYMKWLDSQEPKSVLYISFGTIAGIIKEMLMELAWGLANSHAKFLWILRPDQVIGVLDTEFGRFEKEIEGRGMLASWCDQERVLSHPSIAGFLTHCGWNSTIESISNGVSMICYPLVADQLTNSWYCCNCLGIGLKLSEQVKRDGVEMVVKGLMEGREGSKGMRTKAMEWRKLARQVTMSSLGSSYVNLQNMVTNVLQMQQ